MAEESLAYRNGRACCLAGRPKAACNPYPKDTLLHRDYIRGYETTEKETPPRC